MNVFEVCVNLLLGSTSASQFHNSILSNGDPDFKASPIISFSKNSLYPHLSAKALMVSIDVLRITTLLSANPEVIEGSKKLKVQTLIFKICIKLGKFAFLSKNHTFT